MKKIFLLLLCLFLVTGCSNPAVIQSISVDEVYQNLNNSEYHIIDVRRLYEYEQGHLENAILLPVAEIDKIVDQIPDKKAKIIVYCRTGNRSHDAANRLIELGYTEVYDMDGIESWPYEVIK